jgi:hypothetical protein
VGVIVSVGVGRAVADAGTGIKAVGVTVQTGSGLAAAGAVGYNSPPSRQDRLSKASKNSIKKARRMGDPLIIIHPSCRGTTVPFITSHFGPSSCAQPGE